MDNVALWATFLRKIKRLREAGRPIIYTDELYIHAGHSTKKCWQSTGIQHYAPFDKGERIIIVHAGSKGGFVNGAQPIFKANRSLGTGNFHDDMNYDNFRRWLENQLIPNLSPNSVVALDNAFYQSKLEGRCPI